MGVVELSSAFADSADQVKAFNAALEHPTVSVALRHLCLKDRSFAVSELINRVSDLAGFPNVSVKELISAARAASTGVRGVGVDFDDFETLSFPILTYLGRNTRQGLRVDLFHVVKVGRSRVVISSDRFGVAHISRAEFKARWTGIVLLAEPGQPLSSNLSELDLYRNEVRLIRDVLTRAECSELVDYCERACFKRSCVAQPSRSGRRDVVDKVVRSSSTVALSDRRHPLLARLYEMVAAAEGVTAAHIEDIQCVRYKIGQRFRAHYDGATDIPRLTTYLLYLNDDFEGGDTYFPLFDHSVTPEAGACLRFPSCDPSGRVLWPSLHGGLPVARGLKYALNIWVRCPGSPFR